MRRADDLILEGYRYRVHLRGSAHQNDDNWGGGCSYADYKYSTYWWSGAGTVIELEAEKETAFLFNTYANENSQTTLCEAVLTISRDGSWLWPQIVKAEVLDERKLADLIGVKITERIASRTSSGPLPEVAFGPLKLDEMIQTGIVAEPKTGQIHLPLSI